MTAMTLERPTAQLPDAGALSERQLLGIDCAWCGAHLGVHARRLGEIRDRGCELQLFGCDPCCSRPRLPRRVPGRSWRAAWGTNPAPPAAATPRRPPAPPAPRADDDGEAPPWAGSLLARLPRWTAASTAQEALTVDCDADPATVRRVAAGLRALPNAPP